MRYNCVLSRSWYTCVSVLLLLLLPSQKLAPLVRQSCYSCYCPHRSLYSLCVRPATPVTALTEVGTPCVSALLLLLLPSQKMVPLCFRPATLVPALTEDGTLVLPSCYCPRRSWYPCVSVLLLLLLPSQKLVPLCVHPATPVAGLTVNRSVSVI